MKKFLLMSLLVSVFVCALSANGTQEKQQGSDGHVSISIIMPDQGRVYKDGTPTIEAIEEKTNTKIDLELVPYAEFLNKINILAAANQLSDIVGTLGYDAIPYASQGVFLDLNDLYAEHGGNFERFVPEHLLKRFRLNDKLYAIPSPNYAGKWNYAIRKDWLDAEKISTPTTLDELSSALRKLKNAMPEIYPYGGYHGGTQNLGANFTPIFGAYGIHPGYTTLVDDQFKTHIISDEYKEALGLLNKFYSDNLIDPEIVIETQDQARSKILQGKTGSFVGWWSIVPVVLMTQNQMAQIDPDVEWELIEPLNGPGGKHVGFQGLSPVGNAVSISRSSKHPEAAMKLLNYLASEEGQIISNYGLEGEHYTKADGIVIRTEQAEIWTNEKWFDSLSQLVKDNELVLGIKFASDPLRSKYMNAANNNALILDIFDGIITHEHQALNADLAIFEQEQFILFVTGRRSLDEFDDYVNEWKKLGGEEIRKSLAAVYNERNGSNIEFSN